MYVAIYNEKTKELFACIDTSGGESILKNGYGFKVFDGTEPVFLEEEDKVLLQENKLIINI